jgi:hypothetical protein
MEAVLVSAFDPSTVVDAIGGLDRSAPLSDRLIAAVELMQARGRRIAGLIHAFAARGSLPDRERGWRVRASEARVVDALALLVEPDRDHLRCSPQEVARRLRLITLALSSPRLADTDPLPPEEIVSLLLDGLRVRSDAPAQTPSTTTIGAPSC